jgi:glycosyltransferase involved in cell wall biosynthesis
MRILLEMRPALDGHAGIPQEARLLFRALNLLDGISADGLIQSSGKVLARGLPTAPGAAGARLSIDQQINRLSRVVISLQHPPKPTVADRLASAFALTVAPTGMVLRHLMGLEQQLGHFDAAHFRDFVWRGLFARTLPYEDFDTVTSAAFRIARVPWTAMHSVGLLTHRLGRAVYPRLNTRDFDVMIAETPYPATISPRTHLVVRYHDAIPILMPHTISDKSFHQASHYLALRRNVRSGAHFACVSDATRKDLLSIFPQVEARSVTIHNMVSHHYFQENSSPTRVPDVLRTRVHTGVRMRSSVHEHLRPFTGDGSMAETFDYLLMVSTIEPRKNHAILLSAWEQLRTERFPRLKLVIVGMLGWDHKGIVNKLRPWLERGELFMLEDVPAGELRLLYRHARATVCPSFGEGFDFSGIEAMRCGGVVAASDIAVHREIFGDAAAYFSPYAPGEAASAITRLIDPAQSAQREALLQSGAQVAQRYLPERILPQWEDFLRSLRTSAEAPFGVR